MYWASLCRSILLLIMTAGIGYCVEYLENGIPKLSGGDIDVSTCVDNFDIHKDNIIRTKDSRAMGAKYLNEIELDSRLECLRLCCETEHCDVFVYEDKGPGSCYLFECGPPKDFKCKFTHHVNYTSGILGVNRHANADLEVEIQHEKDLTRLRKPDTLHNAIHEANALATAAPVRTTTQQNKESARTRAPIESIPKCSRNQFECRSSKDCIAIYNACDGVPQCPDGSDEAPELACPDSSGGTTAAPQMPVPRIAIVPLDSQSIGRLTNHPSQQQKSNAELYPQIPQQRVQSNPAGIPRQDYVGQQISNYQAPQVYQPIPQQPLPQPNWFPHQQNVPQQLMPFQEKPSSRIFNHKESGLQVQEAGPDAARYNNKYGALQTLHRALGYDRAYDGGTTYELHMNQREYPQLPGSGYYNDIYNRQQLPLSPNAKWQNKQESYNHQNGDPYIPLVAAEPNNMNWQPNQAGPNDQITYKPAQEVNNAPVDKAATPKHEQDKMAHELKHSKEHFEASPIEAKAQDHDTHDHTKYAVVVEEMAETIENIEDGVAQTPGGAVLSLTLGLIITCMLAILIGCRLRVVRRRIRRGGKSYAHDADYLVNGMYL